MLGNADHGTSAKPSRGKQSSVLRQHYVLYHPHLHQAVGHESHITPAQTISVGATGSRRTAIAPVGRGVNRHEQCANANATHRASCYALHLAQMSPDYRASAHHSHRVCTSPLTSVPSSSMFRSRLSEPVLRAIVFHSPMHSWQSGAPGEC